MFFTQITPDGSFPGAHSKTKLYIYFGHGGYNYIERINVINKRIITVIAPIQSMKKKAEHKPSWKRKKKRDHQSSPRLDTPKNIIVIILIEPFSRRYRGSLSRERRIVEANIQQANLETIIADEINQLGRLGGDGLLIEEHQQAIQPFGGHTVTGGSKCQQDHLFRSGLACCSRVIGILRMASGCRRMAMNGDLCRGLRSGALFDG